MKRASLAAAWARAPQSRTQTEAIVAKAREAHIDELADIASAVGADSVDYRGRPPPKLRTD